MCTIDGASDDDRRGRAAVRILAVTCWVLAVCACQGVATPDADAGPNGTFIDGGTDFLQACASDSDCAEPLKLKCLAFPGGGSSGGHCTIACANDADCFDLPPQNCIQCSSGLCFGGGCF